MCVIVAACLIAAMVVGCSRPQQNAPAQLAPLPSPTQSEPSDAARPPASSRPSDQAEAPADKTAADDARPAAEPQPTTADAPKWTSLFDGKSLGNWEPTRFGGEGDVKVEKDAIVLEMGNEITGITWKGDPPARMNYEIEIESQRVDGGDFFCGLTFPVGEDFCSLICGGWGGGLTGLSSLDGNDASENETSKWLDYDKGRWYRIRLRVTDKKIEAWLDDKQAVSVETAGRKIGIRPEVELSKPLGIATWRTTGAIKSIRLRQLTEPAAASEATKEPGR